MKKVSLLILVSMILLLAFTSCDLIPMSVQTAIGLHKHEWTEATCEAPKTCAGCDATEGDALGHDWTEATCTTPKTCNVCAATEGDVAAHDYAPATCTAPKTCKGCSATMGKALGHKWNNANCTDPKTCTSCGATEDAALGHTWTEATCTAPESVCEVCGADNPAPEIKHTRLVHMEAVEPGCHYTGYVEYWVCYDCEGVWTDEALTQVSNIKNVVVPELGGDVQHVEKLDPTCHLDGNIEYWYCETCEQVWADEARTLLTTFKSVVVSHDVDNVMHVKAQDPTCHLYGNLEYWYCTVCEAVYTDAALTQLSNLKSVTIPFDYANNIVHVPAADPTCHLDGNVEYWYCQAEGCGAIYTDAAITQLSNRQNVTVPFDYANNIVHVDAVEANCHQKGNVEYWYCSVCDAVYTDSAITKLSNRLSVVTPYTAEIVHVEATEAGCHQKGNLEYWYCSECDAVFTDVLLTQLSNRQSVTVPCTAEIVHVEAKAPGCPEEGVNNDGNVEYWYCAECDAVFTDATLIHISNRLSVVLPASHTGGTATCTDAPVCDACGESYGEALGHDWNEATCDADQECQRCDATNPNSKIASHTVASNYADGALSYSCSTCDLVFSVDTQKFYYDGSDAETAYTFNKNGTMENVKADGVYTAIFNPAVDTAPSDEEFAAKNYAAIDGWAWNTNTKKPGAQPMYWIPGYNANTGLNGFSCENNALGVVSFRIKTSMTNHFTVAVSKERGASDWTGFPTSTIDLLRIGGTTEAEEITFLGGLGAGKDLGVTVPVGEDGWAEFDVKIFIYLTTVGEGESASNTITVAYYINNVFCNTFSGAMTIDSFDIRALYINGWTYTPGTGIVLDDIAFGYTTDSEWIFNDHVHWWKEATCTTPKTCTACGLTEGNSLGHTNGDVVVENETEPTCTANGYHEEVIYCTVCEVEVSRTPVTDSASGHNKDDVITGTPASCLDDGLTDGAKCSVCGEVTVSQTTIPAPGHTDEDGNNICDVEDCKATICDHEGYEVETVTGTAATCTTSGVSDGTKCSNCKQWIKAPETISNLGHTEGDPEKIVTLEPTCTETGLYDTVVKCVTCDTELSRTRDQVSESLGHTPVTDAAVAATCTSTGLTEGSHCDVCDAVIVEQTVTQTIPHTGGTADCFNKAVCTECGGSYGSPKGHAISGTYAESTLTYACSVCNTSYIVGNSQYYNGSNLPVSATQNNTDTTYTADADTGIYKVYNSSDESKQYQAYYPGHSRGNDGMFTDFNCENNAFGIVSFSIRTNSSGAITFSIMEARNNNDGWSDWSTNSLDILSIGAANSTSVTLSGGNISATGLPTIPVTDKWSDWFDVTIFIQFRSTNVITITYFIDGVSYGSYDYDLDNPSSGKTLQHYKIECFFFNSNSTGGTTGYSGYELKNLMYGYDTFGHSPFTAESHTVTEATACNVPATCTCGWVGTGTSHAYSEATCQTLATCAYCDKTTGDYASHNITHSYANSKMVYSCTGPCQYSYTIESEGVYYSGNNISELTTGAYYTGTGASFNNGENTIVAEDGAYKAIQDNDLDATSTGESQMQWWLPHTKDNTSKGVNLNNFTVASGSIGVLSFKINAKLTFTGTYVNDKGNTVTVTDAFTMKLVDNAWAGSNGAIDSNVFTIQPTFADGTVSGYKFMGWNADSTSGSITTVKNITPTADGWTDWIDVKIVLVMHPETETITAAYYINGEYCFTGAQNFSTVTNKKISCVYVNLNARNAGTGYYLKEVAFGHSLNAHDIFSEDHQGKVYTPATCTTPASCECGWNGTETLPHNYTTATNCYEAPACTMCGDISGQPLAHSLAASGYDASAHTLTYACTNDGCNATHSVTGYFYDGTAASASTDIVNASNAAGSFTYAINEGQYELLNGSGANAQITLWYPSNAEGATAIDGLSCANNALGFVSFRMSTYIDGTGNSLGLKAAEARNNTSGGNASTWVSWTDSAFDLLNVGSVQSDSQTSVDVKGFGGTLLGAVDLAKDNEGNYTKWTEWFEVAIIIELNDDNTMTLTYIFNGEYAQTYTGAMTISTGAIKALYLSGYTTSNGSGVKFDDFVFAYAGDSHWTADGVEHTVTASTDCATPSVCTCGWTGNALPHNMTEATCATPATCVDCGATEGDKLAHANYVASYDGTDLRYTCPDCNNCYVLDDYHYFDGTSTSDANSNGGAISNASADQAAFTMDTSNGYIDMYNKTGTASSVQSQLWLPSMNDTTDTLTGCSTANNSVGFMSFRIKPNNDAEIYIILSERRNGNGWDNTTDPSNHWSYSSINTMQIGKVTDGSVTIKGGVNNYSRLTLKTVSLAENDGWINIVIKFNLTSDGKCTYTFFINGENCGTDTQTMNITSGKIRAAYIKSNSTALNAGYAIDDIVLGYTNSDMVEAPLYIEEIAEENVVSETLTTINADKIKQVDQATLDDGTNSNANGWFTKEGGEPVYVTAYKDGEVVEALYFSRSYDWTTYASASQNSGWSEFRFTATGTVTSFSFDYLVKGTAEYKDENGTDYDGTAVTLGTSYVQVKDASGDYIEMADSTLDMDGEWHTMTIELGEGQSITDILVKLYNFQGEMLISNLVVNYAE